jgi:hypothetical protein
LRYRRITGGDVLGHPVTDRQSHHPLGALDHSQLRPPLPDVLGDHPALIFFQVAAPELVFLDPEYRVLARLDFDPLDLKGDPARRLQIS